MTMDMFTDWTQTDPKYFYLRGMVTGSVITLLVGFYLGKLFSKVR